jgi:rhodanese-related sulfurtransferase
LKNHAITPAELQHLLAGHSDVHLIDVRTAPEFESAHIPGSYHVPLDTLKEHRDELHRHVNQPVVLVCQSGARATQAGAHLTAAGMDNVRVLDGGIGAWLAMGGDVNRGPQKWGLERQVRLVAGSLVLASVTGSFFVGPLRIIAGVVGAGLTFSALTNTCGMAAVLSRLPYNQGAACDVRDIIAELAGSETTAPVPAAKAS